MKYLFFSLLLLSIPAHADKIYSNQKCLQIYRSIVVDFADGKAPPRDMMFHYGQMCVSANKKNPEHRTLINAVLSDELAVAIKAKLAEQDIIKL